MKLFLLDLIRKLFNDTQLYEYYVLLNGSACRRNFLSVRSKKKIEKGAQPKRKLRIKQGTRICHIRDCQS